MMQSPVAVGLLALFCIYAVNAVPTSPNPGKKIIFSTDTTIDFENILVNDQGEVPEPDTPEYYEANRWVAVSSEGYEFEGSLEEAKTRMKYEASSEDDGNDPVEFASSPGHPHPMDSAKDSDETDDYKSLASSLDEYKSIVEKRSVIQPDTRIRVSPPRGFPYSAIGRIDLGCTGTFIARRTILTAGHCVYNTRRNQWQRNLNFGRCKDCDPNQGARHIWKWAVTFFGWTRDHRIEYDIAIITVRQSSPSYMEFRYYANLPLTENINIAGYPGDKSGRCLWRSSCTLGEVLNERLRYPCDTAPGMSGSAVYMYWRSTCKRTIIGVHAYGVFGRPPLNSGTRITQYYERCIRSWIPRYGGN